MGETPSIPAFQPDAIRAPETPRSKTSGGVPPAGAAFEALLERLTSRAAELEEKTKSLASPAELPDAVDAARASLEDALTLGEKLLEAYRAGQQGGQQGSQQATHGSCAAPETGAETRP